MKIWKFVVLSALLVFSVQTITSAIQCGNIEEQKEANKNAVMQIKTKGVDETVQKMNALTERYYSNLRTCEPLHLHHYIDIFGFKLTVKIDINGWNADNKCEYRMTGNIGGIGKDIREVYDVKIADTQIEKIQPKIECNFSKEQLNIIVDAVIARNAKNAEYLQEMLKNPNEKYVSSKKSTMTKEEEKLLAMLLEGKACSIPNKDELMNQFSELMLNSPAPSTNSSSDDGSVISKPSAPQK